MEPARRFASIPVADIRVPADTLRLADDGWVEVLAILMQSDGQLQPIEVGADRKGFVLVFGLHRLLAARKNNWKNIDAVVDSGMDTDVRRRRAVQENVGRRELSVLDRAIHIAAWKELYEAENPTNKHGGKRGNQQVAKNGDLAVRFSVAAAEKLGVGERSVQRSVAIAHGIGTPLRARIALTWLADSQVDLEALAAAPEARKSKIVDLILREKDPAGSVAAAIAILDGEKPPTESERHFNLAMNAFARLQGKALDQFFTANESAFVAWQKRKARR
jgi:ParB family chromosome partitioning protein